MLPPRASWNDWQRAEPDANHDGSLEGAANTDLAEVSAQEYHSFFTDYLRQKTVFSIPARSEREGISILAPPEREGISIPSQLGGAGMYVCMYSLYNKNEQFRSPSQGLE